MVPDLWPLWQAWLRLRPELTPNTIHLYYGIGKRFARWMNGRSVDPKTMVDWMGELQGYKTRYGAPIAAEKVNRYNMMIRKFMRWLKAMGVIKHDPTDVLPTLRKPGPPPSKTWTHAEYEQIKAYLTRLLTKPRGQWAQPFLWLIVLGYRTGLSFVDCCHLKWSEVFLRDDGPSFIQRRRQKLLFRGDGALCTVPIIPGTDVHEMLLLLKSIRHLNHRRQDGIEYVHQDCPGLYTQTKVRVSIPMKRIFQRALGGPGPTDGRTFRHFRHSFCSNLMNSGAEAAFVCKMTGHAGVNTLIRYINADLKSLEEQLAKAFRWAEEQSSKVKIPERTADNQPQRQIENKSV